MDCLIYIGWDITIALGNNRDVIGLWQDTLHLVQQFCWPNFTISANVIIAHNCGKTDKVSRRYTHNGPA